MELVDYMFLPDQEIWRGYPKAHPDYQAYGKSFEELQLKLRHLRLGLTRSTNSSTLLHSTSTDSSTDSGKFPNSITHMRREANGRC